MSALETGYPFTLKIAALLHDPPDKPWHVTGRLRKGHEEVRDNVVKRLMGKGFLNTWFKGDAKSYVDRSDRLAAAFDRWLVDIAEQAVGKLPPSKFSVVLANPLSGASIYVRKPEDAEPEKWIEELERLRDNIDKLELGADRWKYLYHLFYAFLEVAYCESYPGCVGPADTRCPHHTVFDHVYTASSTSNLFAKGSEPRGFLVMLDLPGIASFIKASRKIRDLWFSSWFISTAAWHLVEELVEHVGPDVLLLPTARWNPFYYRWLLRRLEELGYPVETLKEKLRRLSFALPLPRREGGGGDWGILRLDEPISLIPGMITLLLPDYDLLTRLLPKGRLDPEAEDPAGELARYFYRRYREFHEHILNCIEERVRGLEEGELRRRLIEAFERMRRLNVHHVPPLALRVTTVRVPEDIRERLEKLAKEVGEDWVYSAAVEELNRRSRFTKVVRGAGHLAALFTEYTEELWRRGESYKYCTVCGELPAVLSIPCRGGAVGRGEITYEAVVPKDYRPHFDEGEHLCPYCLVKRLAATVAIEKALLATVIGGASYEEELKRVKEFERIINRMKENVERVRSTSWYAAYPLFEVLAGRRLPNVGEELAKHASDVEERLEELPEGPERELLAKGVYGLRKLAYRVESGTESVRALTDNVDDEEVEGIFRVGIPGTVFRELELGYTPPFSAYYALLSADGDYIGKLLGGELDGALQADRLGILMDVIRATGAYDSAELGSIRNELVKRLARLEKEELILVWPSYHVAISRALILTALKDIELAKRVAGDGGFVVYSGGDDLLAIMSPIHALGFIGHSRRIYSEGDQQSFHGVYFDDVEAALLPTMGFASKSYALTLRHFKYPLSLALRGSREDLEKAAKRAELTIGSWARKKDALAISYTPRGGGKVVKAVLPMTFPAGSIASPLEVLIDVLQALQWGRISHSLVYDLKDLLDRYEEPVREVGAFNQYLGQVRRIIERNVALRELVELTAEAAARGFQPLLGAMVSSGSSSRSLFGEVCRALWALMSALRVKRV